MAKRVTKKEDAESIIGKAEADKIEEMAVQTKSDVLIEMADTDEDITEESTDIPTEEVDTVSEPESVVEESLEEKAGSRGGYLVKDNGNGQPALPTEENGQRSHRLMGAAWAALHGGYRGNKYEGAGKEQAIAKLKRMYKAEGMTPPTSKSLTEKDMGEDNPIPTPVEVYKPFGGATSMVDAQAYLDAQDEQMRISQVWYMFSCVADNIMSDENINEQSKVKALSQAVSELKQSITAKALLDELSLGEGKYKKMPQYLTKDETEELYKTLSKSNKTADDESPAEDTKGDESESMDMSKTDKKKKMGMGMMKSDAEEKSTLDLSVEKLYTLVQDAMNSDLPLDKKYESIQPALNEMGLAIQEIVSKSVTTAKEETKPSADSKMVMDSLAELTKTVQGLALTVEQMKSNTKVETPRVPAPRGISPSVIKSVVAKSQTEPIKPGSLKDIVARSVDPRLVQGQS